MRYTIRDASRITRTRDLFASGKVRVTSEVTWVSRRRSTVTSCRLRGNQTVPTAGDRRQVTCRQRHTTLTVLRLSAQRGRMGIFLSATDDIAGYGEAQKRRQLRWSVK